ncbi:hypothetical protein [Arthrobacter tecti]
MVAEFEADLIRTRTHECMAVAKPKVGCEVGCQSSPPHSVGTCSSGATSSESAVSRLIETTIDYVTIILVVKRLHQNVTYSVTLSTTCIGQPTGECGGKLGGP